MTRKDFERIATGFGMGLRYLKEDDEPGYWWAIKEFCMNAQEVNPRFDQDRFESWVREVANHARDESGKKVA